MFDIFGAFIPLGMPAGHNGADVAVGRWKEHWVPNEVRSREARLESSGMSIPEVQTNNSITLPLPALLRVDKQQAFIKGFDSSPEPHANVNSREPAPGPRNPETLSGW